MRRSSIKQPRQPLPTSLAGVSEDVASNTDQDQRAAVRSVAASSAPISATIRC